MSPAQRHSPALARNRPAVRARKLTPEPFGDVKPLGEGARVALIAPAGIIRRADDVSRAVANAESLGWTPVVGEHVRERFGYMAGSDEGRLHDINEAFRSDEIDGVWCIRGGYGTMRLLDDLDYRAFSRRPKPLIGFSDVTGLHSAIHAQCGKVTFHGPTARVRLTDLSRESLRCAVIGQQDSAGYAPRGRTITPGMARGRLAGGNLAIVCALLGTPFTTDFERAILVIEDVGEAIYRIDRMLRQLLLADALQRCAGIVAGDFRPPPNELAGGNRELDEVLREAAEEAGIPCFAGAPLGHIPDQWTLPLGAIAEIDADNCSLRVIAQER